MGLLAGRFAAAEISGDAITLPPPATALGALLGHITGGAEADSYQPMNVNFGLFPPIEGKVKKKERKAAYTGRAREALKEWIADHPPCAKSRSEEHTSELQSLMRISYTAFCLKQNNISITI